MSSQHPPQSSASDATNVEPALMPITGPHPDVTMRATSEILNRLAALTKGEPDTTVEAELDRPGRTGPRPGPEPRPSDDLGFDRPLGSRAAATTAPTRVPPSSPSSADTTVEALELLEPDPPGATDDGVGPADDTSVTDSATTGRPLLASPRAVDDLRRSKLSALKTGEEMIVSSPDQTTNRMSPSEADPLLVDETTDEATTLKGRTLAAKATPTPPPSSDIFPANRERLATAAVGRQRERRASAPRGPFSSAGAIQGLPAATRRPPTEALKGVIAALRSEPTRDGPAPTASAKMSAPSALRQAKQTREGKKTHNDGQRASEGKAPPRGARPSALAAFGPADPATGDEQAAAARPRASQRPPMRAGAPPPPKRTHAAAPRPLTGPILPRKSLPRVVKAPLLPRPVVAPAQMIAPAAEPPGLGLPQPRPLGVGAGPTPPLAGAAAPATVHGQRPPADLVTRHPWILLALAMVIAGGIVLLALVKRAEIQGRAEAPASRISAPAAPPTAPPTGNANGARADRHVAAATRPATVTLATGEEAAGKGIPRARPLPSQTAKQSVSRCSPARSRLAAARAALARADYGSARARYGALLADGREIIAGHARASAELGNEAVLDHLDELTRAYDDLRLTLEVRLLLGKGKLREAEQAYGDLPRRLRRSPWMRLNLARIKARRGRLKAAQRIYRALLRAERARLLRARPRVEAMLEHAEVLRRRRYLSRSLALVKQARELLDAEPSLASAGLEQRAAELESKAGTALRRWRARKARTR